MKRVGTAEALPTHSLPGTDSLDDNLKPFDRIGHTQLPDGIEMERVVVSQHPQ
jgi:hypothetical protein